MSKLRSTDRRKADVLAVLGQSQSDGHVAGAGLTNMRDRLGAVGGTITVESALGKGTRLSGAVPLA